MIPLIIKREIDAYIVSNFVIVYQYGKIHMLETQQPFLFNFGKGKMEDIEAKSIQVIYYSTTYENLLPEFTI